MHHLTLSKIAETRWFCNHLANQPEQMACSSGKGRVQGENLLTAAGCPLVRCNFMLRE
jgi:hypothetical protein